MNPFVTHRGRLAVLDWADVNTDLIIPARYLKRIQRTGYGPLLFADKRYVPGGAPEIDHPDQHGELDPEFPLNQTALKDATVLVTGRNFGCGSSREHAVWAIMQAGYRAIIAPGKDEGFADIFESNSLNNGLLAIELSDEDWKRVAAAGRRWPGRAEVTIDLRDQTVTLQEPDAGARATPGPCFVFEIPESYRHRLLKGLDAIAETLSHEPEIHQYEERAASYLVPHRKGNEE
jgi:3-isopropylmalate/(R)-2-methylmalate dehydratase small subunit